MKPFSLLACFLVVVGYAFPQDPPIKLKKYKIAVSDSTSVWFTGYLYDITDTSIKVSAWPVRMRAPELKDISKEVNVSQIRELTIKQANAAGRGAWKGAVIGTLAGVIAGFIEGDDPAEYWFGMTAAEKALIYGGMGGSVGTGLGALIGALTKKKFIIGGNKERFNEMRVNVLNQTYGNAPNSRR